MIMNNGYICCVSISRTRKTLKIIVTSGSRNCAMGNYDKM